MSNSDIITPLRVSQDKFLYTSGLFAQYPLGGICENAEDNLVKLLLLSRQVMIFGDGIVEILLLPSRTKRDADRGRTGVYGVKLGVESDLLVKIQPRLP